MKKVVLIILPVLLFICCGQNDNGINIEAQAEIMKQDSVVIQFYKASSRIAQILSEEGLNYLAYRKIVKSLDWDYCNIKKDAFKGNALMEEFNQIHCDMDILGPKMYEKYPFVLNLSEEKRRELTALLMVRRDFDIEKIRKNFKSFETVND